MVGDGLVFDPTKHFIVCVNMLGSCYGSTGPNELDPASGKPYLLDFPLVTIRDMVKLNDMVRKHLGIAKIHLLIGGSMGGQQALEWSIMAPEVINNLVVIAANASHSPYGIAINEAQRMAIEADPTFFGIGQTGGLEGMKAARAMALTTYRNYDAFLQTQSEEVLDKINDFKASSYQRYQGQKLAKRFSPYSYWFLTKAMDSHNVGRGRNSREAALRVIRAKTLVVGIQTDQLFPIREQHFLAEHISSALFKEIASDFGHDGFLLEYQQLSELINELILR